MAAIIPTEASLNFQLQLLIELQKIDARIITIQDQRQTYPEQLKAAEAPFLEAKQRLLTRGEAAEALIKERRDREGELSVQEEYIVKIRGRLTELKTNKEYQAHLFEIDMAKKKKDRLEEAVLEVLEQVEQNQGATKELEVFAQEAETVLEQETKRLESLVASLEQELSVLTQKQKEVGAQLDSTLYARYTRIKCKRKGFAVTPVKAGACSGCRLQLPPQLVAEVKRSNELLSCSYCHRILYWDEQPTDHSPDISPVSP